jgi:cobyrinic acid a,c-diamide synthase
MGQATGIRTAIAELPRGVGVPETMCRELAHELMPYTRLDRLCQVADRPALAGNDMVACNACDRPPRVAVAFDEAFQCYFPDTLEMLERRGATVVAFSPLRDGRLPPKTDIVYFGCGHPERHSRALADNHCMMLALKEHVCSGRRLYAEGGGLAYLCEAIRTPDGHSVNMVGIFPAVACVQSHAATPRPLELVLRESTWLAPRGTRLRGYLNSNWQLEPTAAWSGSVAEATSTDVLVSRRAAVGSLAHLHFSTCEPCFSSFFRHHSAERELAQT